MTLLKIDLSDVLDEYHDDDAVVVWSPHHREGSRGQVVNTAQKLIRLTAGKAEQEVEPGPLMVKMQCRGIADTAPKLGTVPESGTVTLNDVLDGAWEYSPEVVRAAQRARDAATDARDEATRQAGIAQEGADRVGSAERVLEAEDTAVNAAADAEEFAQQAATAVGPRRIDLVSPTQAQIDSTLAALPAGSTVMNLSTGEVWGL